MTEIPESISRDLEESHNRIKKIVPEYTLLREGRSMDEIQDIILQKGNNTCLIEYFMTNNRLYIFVVSSHEFHVRSITLTEDMLIMYMNSFEKELMNYHLYGNIGSTWLGLSKYLIEPISEYLLTANLIYFIPYGLLHYLPLHLLEYENEPLIKKHPVAYSPSASLLRFYNNKGSGMLKSCASFAAGGDRENYTFIEEVQEVAKLFNTSPYLHAIKNNVKVSTNNDILHFSCHGYFNNIDPLASGIELQDGILTAKEIFDLKLNSELVTLSACQTGINRRTQGDELIGLTRSVIHAGSPSVIVSLWSVYDPSTRELIIEFYKFLKNGNDKATALQQAQIKIMQKQEFSHPYYWAPFTLVGDWK